MRVFLRLAVLVLLPLLATGCGADLQSPLSTESPIKLGHAQRIDPVTIQAHGREIDCVVIRDLSSSGGVGVDCDWSPR